MSSKTDLDELDVRATLDSCWNGIDPPPRTEFDHQGLRRFLFRQLGLLRRSAETTRPIQIYWTLNPLCMSYRDEGIDPASQEEFLQIREMIVQTLRRDFCQRRFHHPHVMAAYGTVLSFRLLGVEMGESDKDYVLDLLQSLLIQHPTGNAGGFRACPEGECEARSTYAACVTAWAAGLFEEAEPRRERAKALFQHTPGFFRRHISFAGGFGANSFEPHCAYVFCSLAGLRLLSTLVGSDLVHALPERAKEDMKYYLITRQQNVGLFNGRPNKHVDGCYTFWVAGAMAVLCGEGPALFDTEALKKALVNFCQDEAGGLRDKPGLTPDSFHCCYVLAGWNAARGALQTPEIAK